MASVWFVLAALAVLTGACRPRPLPLGENGRGGTGPGIGGFGPGIGGAAGSDTTGAGGGGGTFTPTRAVDMLFVIDDSALTEGMQRNLTANFPSILNRLMDPPGLPDLHLAVISADIGAGDGSYFGCNATGGKNGVFQHAARGSCAATGLDPDATYIVDGADGKNYTGNLADVFACVAPLGAGGCTIQQPLAAVTRALGADGRPPPPENQGFLRPDAFLFIAVLTRSDDCSVPPGSSLFDTAANHTVADPLGPPTHFRCNEFGHRCGQPPSPPPRIPPHGGVPDSTTLRDCAPAEDAGMLIPVRTLVTQLRSLKRFPDQQILVSAIAGPAAPYSMFWLAPATPGTGPWPAISPSCQALGASAEPGVRLTALVDGFGANGLLLPACGTDYGPSLDRLAALLNQPR